MWEIWTNKLMAKTLKSCPKSNKSPNLVTLIVNTLGLKCANAGRFSFIFVIFKLKFTEKASLGFKHESSV